MSGIGEKLAENIVNYRLRTVLRKQNSSKVPRLGEKHIQGAAFIRISNAKILG
jgi:transcriptional accessory protein Tex/SPT6